MTSPLLNSDEDQPLEKAVAALGLTQIQRHLLLCSDQTKPKCCDKAVGLETWNYLKQRLKELGLDQPTPERSSCVFRTKANCLRVCQQGPILLVYPDGVWYHSVTPTVMEAILQQHILGNQILEEYAFVNQPLELPPMSPLNLLDILRADYQHFPKNQTYSIYASDVYFKDPLTEFNGLDRYKQMIQFINQWFKEPQLDLHSAQQTDREIRTDWTLSWTTPLPWQPRIQISGWTEMRINEAGLICSHIDYWSCSPWDVFKQHFSSRAQAAT